MTSALQLLYIWKSSARRRQDQASELGRNPADPVLDAHRRPREQRHGHRGAENVPSRRSHAGAHKCRNPGKSRSHKVLQERELGRIAHNGSDDYWSGDNSIVGVSCSALSSLGLSTTDRLPGAVMEARKRLFERLRGVSLAENRQCSFHYDVLHDRHTSRDNDASNVAFNHAIPTPSTSSSTTPARSTVQTENFACLGGANKKQFPAPGRDAFWTLKGEVFDSDKKHGADDMGSPPECGICLERYRDGDRLIRLCCSHKFHSACLDPWVRSCGGCPYCRADIIC